MEITGIQNLDVHHGHFLSYKALDGRSGGRHFDYCMISKSRYMIAAIDTTDRRQIPQKNTQSLRDLIINKIK